mmetsp:Transcript_6233/g.25002  ORF Transcript_6233/g.25002 Transcript_6233/m.25002 type:complete len:266 (+) Transcript_6233:4449-5246(+)
MSAALASNSFLASSRALLVPASASAESERRLMRSFAFCSWRSATSLKDTRRSLISAPAEPGLSPLGTSALLLVAPAGGASAPPLRASTSTSRTATWCPRSFACASRAASSRLALFASRSASIALFAWRRASEAASSRRASIAACVSSMLSYSARCCWMAGALRSNSARMLSSDSCSRRLSARSLTSSFSRLSHLSKMDVRLFPSRIMLAAAAAGDSERMSRAAPDTAPPSGVDAAAVAASARAFSASERAAATSSRDILSASSRP